MLSDALDAGDDLVTVLIPAKDEEASIADCLSSVLAQDHANLQVVVIDGASSDGTASIVAEFRRRDKRVELLHNAAGAIPVSLNLGVAVARGAWLVRIDAHATVPRDYVRIALHHLLTARWGGVGGRKDGVGKSPAGRAIAAAMGSQFGVGNSTYHYGDEVQTVEHIPFGAYPVALIRALGGWDEQLRVNQDFEFDYRVREAGHELLFDPRLRIDWQSRQTILQLYRQYRRYGKGKTIVAAKHPASVRLRHLAAPALVASWAVALVLAPRRPAAAAAVVAPYAAGLAVASVHTARRLSERRARMYVPLAFVAMHAGWGLGWWEGQRELYTSALIARLARTSDPRL